jgi:colanic acid biosynthesis glycosyl transferase WcaI
MAKIILVNRFFYPDQSATSQILTDLAFTLADDRRHEIHVIASRGSIVGDRPMPPEETVRGVFAHRIGAPSKQASGLVGRLGKFISFYWSGAKVLRRLATPGSIVVVETDPPLLSIWALALLAGRNVALVNWLQDIYPEVAIRSEIPIVRGFAGTFLKRLRDVSLRRAAANVALGTRMLEHVLAQGAPKATARVIANWVDDETIRPVPRDANPLRASWGLQDRFVIGYSGNLGRVHEFETTLGAMELLRDRRELCFLFIGGGFQYARLKEELARRRLEGMALFKPYQDQSELSNSLSLPDAHWVSLRPEFEGLIVPSKFIGIAAAGRPTLAIADPDGDVARLVREFDCGAIVAPGDPSALAAAIERMLADPAACDRWGANARSMIEQAYSRCHAIDRWRGLLAELAR